MSVQLDPIAVSAARPSPLGPWQTLVWAAWFGILSGTLELVIFLLKCHYFDTRNFNTSRHLPWMYPVAGLLVVSVPGLMLALGARVWRERISSPAVIAPLAFFAYLGLLCRLPIYTAVCLFLAAGMAVRTARFIASRSRRCDSLVRRSLIVMIGLLTATILVCHGREFWAEYRALAVLPKGAPGAKNVLLLVLDTVRARSLSLYGYERDTSPNLNRLAARGVRFGRALATAPWTAPSHASMFTGRWCHELSVGWNEPLDHASPTLAEYLGKRGYATAGFVANTTYCSYETGLDRGFVHYEDYDVSVWSILLCSSLIERVVNFVERRPGTLGWIDGAVSIGSNRKSAARINSDLLGWLDRHEDRPFFAFVNYFDAHHPYLPPNDAERPSFGRTPETLDQFRMLKTWWDLDKRRLDGRSVELVRDSYDQCITYIDQQIRKLFEELARRELLDKTLVVITADHGEHMGEQGLFGHGCSLYLSELHVPLVLVAPGIVPEGTTIGEPVSLRDLPATIVDRLGLREGSPFPGRSLARTWTENARSTGSDGELVLSEINAPPEADPNRGESPVCRGPMTSLLDRGYHYIRGGAGREELFELETDPDETRNLAGSPEVAVVLDRFRRSLGFLVGLNSKQRNSGGCSR